MCSKLAISWAAALICVGHSGIASALGAGGALVLDGRRQLFLDDYLVESRMRVERVIEQARKFPGNPVLWPTESWEPPKAVVYGSILRDGSKFRMWYLSGPGVGYAESDDGIAWRKPRMELALIGGRPSNLLFVRKGTMEGTDAFPFFHELFGVCRDDRDPNPARRFKMGFLDIDWKYEGPDGLPWRKNQRRGLGVAVSADGLHWNLVDSWATSAIVDGATHWMIDPASGKYVLYGRMLKARPEVVAAWQTNVWFKEWFSGRAVARVESDDFMKWDFTKPGTAPIVLTADLQDKPGTEIYSMKVFPYQGIYIGLVQVFHATPEDPTLDIQLAVSRDTLHFERVGDRSPFLGVGPIGAWDRFNLSLANNEPFVVGDELRFYYSGRLYRHNPYAGPDTGPEKCGVGFATIQRDRFVALAASFDRGEVLTRTLRLKGSTLHLNAKSDFGEIIVELVNVDDRVVARSKPIRRDSLEIPVEWDAPLERMPDECRLRVHLKNARLYSIWCL